MQLIVRQNLLQNAGSVRDFAERRLGLALARFAPRVGRVSVTVRDINGDRGGDRDKHCRAAARLTAGGIATGEATAATWQAAVAEAVDRLSRVVARIVERGNSRRGRTPMGGSPLP